VPSQPLARNVLPALPRWRLKARAAALPLGALLLSVGLVCIGVAFGVIATRPALPAFEAIRQQHAQGSHHYLLDRNGVVVESWLRPGMAGWQAPWRRLDDFSHALKEAVIASEDRRFFEHAGVDLSALAASAVQSLGQRRGGSTITMQTARLLLGREPLPPTLWGKLRQIDAAWALERRWSKAQILEAYLHLAPLRGGVRGFHSAQALWLRDLSAAQQESAWPLLVAMLPAPQASPAMLGRRSCAVVRRWAEQSSSQRRICRDHTSPDWEHWEAVWGEIFKPDQALAHINTAQAAIDFVVLKAPLTATQATAHEATPANLRSDVAKRSTLDAPMQVALNRHLTQGLERMRIGDVNAAAAVLIDNASGDVLAIGSAQVPANDPNAPASAPVRKAPALEGIHTKKTLASTLKPFLYAQAQGAGLLTPQERISIRNREFRQGPCDARPYRPRDSVALYQRQVSPALGLAASSNIAAVDIISRLGPERFESKLHALGILTAPAAASTSCQPMPRYGHALALGAAEGSVLALTNAYRSLANGGLYSPARLWMDAAPASVAAPAAADAPQPLLSASSTAWVSAVLSDQRLRFEGFGPRNALDTPYWSASKTGTSDRALDNWAVGYTRQHTLGIWIGNTRGEPMKGVFGPTGAASIWRAIMDEASAAHPSSAQASVKNNTNATK
jgi:penicillin-binding protein 1C